MVYSFITNGHLDFVTHGIYVTLVNTESSTCAYFSLQGEIIYQQSLCCIVKYVYYTGSVISSEELFTFFSPWTIAICNFTFLNYSMNNYGNNIVPNQRVKQKNVDTVYERYYFSQTCTKSKYSKSFIYIYIHVFIIYVIFLIYLCHLRHI